MNCAETLRTLQAHQPELQALGIQSLELFGSVARNEATATSDVDLLAEFVQPPSLFELARIRLHLQDLLQRPVDLGTRTALKEHLREVVRETIRVF